MKRYSGIVVCFVLLPLLSMAQLGWYTGIKGGISIPKLRAPNNTTNSYSNGFQTVVGPQAGIIGEYRFTPFFSIQTELNYSSQGGEKNGEQRIATKDFKAYIPANISLPEYIYANFNNKISLVYVELPVMPKFSFALSPVYRLSVFGGPYIGYLIKAEGAASGKSKIYTDPQHNDELSYNGFTPGVVDFTRTEDILDQLNRTNYGLQGGASMEYTTRPLNYFFTIGGNYGFRRLQKDPNFGDNKTGSLIISLGLTRKL